MPCQELWALSRAMESFLLLLCMQSSHEPGCALRSGGKFDESDYDNIYSDEEQYPSQSSSGDWRQTHQELLRNIRRAKQAAKRRHSREGSSTTRSARSNPEDNLGKQR